MIRTFKKQRISVFLRLDAMILKNIRKMHFVNEKKNEKKDF